MSSAVLPAPGRRVAVAGRASRLGLRARGAARAVFQAVHQSWTGVVVAASAAIVTAGAVSGTGLFLGAGPLVDALVAGAIDVLLIGVLWALVRGVRRLLAGITGRLAAATARRAARGRVLRIASRILARLDRWLRHPHRSSGLALATLGFVILVPSPPFSVVAPSNAYLPAIAVAIVVGALTGLALAIAPQALDSHRPRSRLVGAAVVLAVAVTLVAGGLAWATWPGPGTVAAMPPIAVAATAIDLPDPGLRGPFAVPSTAYGPGIDPRRAAFGADTPIRTGTVDVHLANPDMAFPGGDYTRWFIGGGMDALPLNALVWYPAGQGPFPLVLVVHGNHAMGDYSEGGYAYLGEHLASRGFIVASVDEASLNGDMFGDFDGAEMPARAFVLLKHLELWRGWNADPSSPFHGIVDMDRVALMGHSRGGEAAAVAAAMAHADGASLTLAPFPTGLDVDAVVGIAPPDFGWPGGGATRLDGVDYLTLQGGLDADMAWWASLGQFARASVTDDPAAFKAAAWIRRANHGRFNTVWDLGDAGTQGEYLLDQASLLTPAEQQDVAKTLIAGFLEASLLGHDGYRSLFAVPAAGRGWLPSDTYVTRLVEGSTILLADSDEVGTRVVRGEGDTRVMLATPMTRASGVNQGNHVASMAWSKPGVASAVVALPATGGPLDGVRLGEAATLRFAVATASLDPRAEVPALTVELEDRAGVRADVPLDAFGGVFPAIATPPMKDAVVAGIARIAPAIASDAETHLQTFALPLAAFRAAAPGLDTGALAAVRFRVESGSPGAIYLDEIGIDPGR